MKVPARFKPLRLDASDIPATAEFKTEAPDLLPSTVGSAFHQLCRRVHEPACIEYTEFAGIVWASYRIHESRIRFEEPPLVTGTL